MIKSERVRKLPGAKLRQFAEKYFEQPGLERIALPIIADLQREYSSGPHASLKRFFLLLRGYLGFWKSVALYSLFSNEGDIRVLKSNGFFRLLGTAAGVMAALLGITENKIIIVKDAQGEWSRISLFPDLLTALAVLCLLCLAVWFCVRQLHTYGFPDIWRVSGKISLPVGIILWMTSILLLARLWARPPDAFNLILTFIAVSAVVFVCRTISCSIVWCVFAVGRSTKTIY